MYFQCQILCFYFLYVCTLICVSTLDYRQCGEIRCRFSLRFVTKYLMQIYKPLAILCLVFCCRLKTRITE
uniref:Secreted protein n=1 Tax=Romanomermis culicivorax TaxID=13658 RepID=A0A915LAP0_ROMCU